MLYFTRHGESYANHTGLFAGQRNDSPLTEKGIINAQNIARTLSTNNIHIDQIVYSPLRRTAQTATVVADSLELPAHRLIEDKRLEEYDMGSLTGTPIHAITPDEILTHPDTEDPNAFRNRVLEGITDAAKLEGNTLVVSHDGVGRMLQAIKQGIEPIRFYEMPQLANGQILQLLDYNIDTAYV